jgi:hypothetical protein
MTVMLTALVPRWEPDNVTAPAGRRGPADVSAGLLLLVPGQLLVLHEVVPGGLAETLPLSARQTRHRLPAAPSPRHRLLQ